MNRPILTADQMRSAEAASSVPETELMERAGNALAEAVHLFIGPRPTLVLAGPGNNGGDGYVAARHLTARGYDVRVAVLAEPASDTARWAASQWTGPVERLAEAHPAQILVDCLFGTGLTRGLETEVASRLTELVEGAVVAVACDLPSGMASDDGSILSTVSEYDLTVTFGALKPSHCLMPAKKYLGRLVLADIGITAESDWFEIGAPQIPPLDPAGHKYDRGLVHCLAGKMPGAIALAARAAARAGAGYVRVSTSRAIDGLPAAIVQTDTAVINDPRVGCILVGPGLGDVPQILTLALTAPRPIVIDADAIGLVGEPERLHGHDVILTPHEGEFVKLFGELEGSKPERALAAAARSQSIVVYKGPDTLVASPDGRLGFAPPAPAWLASAGTGDVLAGIIATMRARGLPPFEAACAGVWLHGSAAERAGPGMIADDLIAAL